MAYAVSPKYRYIKFSPNTDVTAICRDVFCIILFEKEHRYTHIGAMILPFLGPDDER